MISQQELDRMLADFYVGGARELPDRVIDEALIQIQATEQRRQSWVPRRVSTMHLSTRFAVAAAIAVIAVGGALYALRPSQPPVGAPSPTTDGTPKATLEASPATAAGTWTMAGNMSNARRGEPTATRLRDGRVLVAGGYSQGRAGANATAELYDPTTGSWTRAAAMGTERGAGHRATLLADGRVLVTGGDLYGVAFAAAEIYDPGSNSWTFVAPMIEPRFGHTSTRLADGRVLVAGGSHIPPGGEQVSGNPEVSLASAELFDPATGVWTATAPMSVDRSGATATLFLDGKVLVAGGATFVPGSDSNPALDTAELYDPATGSWTTTGRMPTPRGGHTAIVLPSGQVLVLGGYADTGSTASAELYDPRSGTWTVGPKVAGVTATLLNDGLALVTGGPGDSGGPNPSWLYDPTSGSLAPTAPMLEARSIGSGDYTATLLLDGTVLVAGGEGDTFDVNGNESFPGLTTTELYHPARRP